MPVVLILSVAGLAQDTPAPPDYRQDSIIGPAAAVARAWETWKTQDRGLEQKVLREPMADARTTLQQSLGTCLNYVDSRRAYAAAVASYLDKRRTESRSNPPLVTVDLVYHDQIDVLGLNMAALQEKLTALRDTPDWLAIRRAVQPESARLLSLEAKRRSEAPLDLALKQAPQSSPISTILYREAERELAEVLEKLWTRYYQAVIDSIEQRPGGESPLVVSRKSGDNASASPSGAVHAVSLPVVPEDPIVGTWIYVEGSQEFNGIAEPRHVMLEIRLENGMLVGRYRAELTDFEGVRKVDLRLQGSYTPGRGKQTLDFESKDPVATGSVILEGPAGGGGELMLVRAVTAPNPIPRGREVLRKR